MPDLQSLKTPCLILDVDRVRRNAARISGIARANNVGLRPHAKTHKSVEIARIQTAEHNGALTVSTLAEARAFSAYGFADFTYAVPIEPGKFAEVVEIVQSGVNLNLITDDAETVAALDEAADRAGVKLSVFLEVDCGDHRSGIEPTSTEAVSLARQISDARNLNFAGILTHGGHSYGARSIDEIRRVAAQERDVTTEFAERLRADSIEVPTVSIGSTPTAHHADHLNGIDEIRPGNYIFFDAFQATLGSCGFDDCALTVLAAVVHRNRAQRKVIVDAGAIALSKDRGAVHLDANCGFGRVFDLAGNDLNATVGVVSQEHGTIYISDEAAFDRLKVGSRVRILANHSCLTAAQHDFYHVLENGKIIDRWTIYRGW